MLKSRVISQCMQVAKQVEKANFARLQTVRWTATVTADKVYYDDATLAAAKPFEEIPSMMMLPYIGTAWIYLPIIGRYDIRLMHIAADDKRRRLGDIFREKVGSLNMVISFNPDDMQTLFNHEGLYPTRFEFTSLKAYRESRKQWYSSTGLLILQGKDWHDLRTKTQKHLMKPKAIQAYLNPMQDVAREFVDKLHMVRDAKKEVPNFLGELYKWALESVALVGLDTRLGCFKLNLSPDSDGMRMINAVQAQFQLMYNLEAVSGNIQFWRLFTTPTWKKFTAAGDVFSEIAFKHINLSVEKLKTAVNEDRDLTLLQQMLTTKGLDVSGAMVTVADMLMAGIDTTSHTVGFVLYHLARNPEKQELLHQELKKILPNREDRITRDTFNEFKFLKACIKESLRLHPIIGGTARIVDHDIIFSGYRVPAGTIAGIAMQSVYRDAKYFPKPEEFLPERWLNKDENFHPFSYIPFGIGTRSCVGRRLAELEMICALTEILRSFKIEYHFEDIDLFTRMLNVPDKPLRYNFIER